MRGGGGAPPPLRRGNSGALLQSTHALGSSLSGCSLFSAQYITALPGGALLARAPLHRSPGLPSLPPVPPHPTRAYTLLEAWTCTLPSEHAQGDDGRSPWTNLPVTSPQLTCINHLLSSVNLMCVAPDGKLHAQVVCPPYPCKGKGLPLWTKAKLPPRCKISILGRECIHWLCSTLGHSNASLGVPTRWCVISHLFLPLFLPHTTHHQSHHTHLEFCLSHASVGTTQVRQVLKWRIAKDITNSQKN